eukprot:g6437.t1
MWSRFVLTAVLLSQLVAQLAQSTSANAFGYEEVLVIDDCHCHPVTRERISNEIVDLQGEQQTASARSQQLEREAKSLALAYDRCKEMNAASAQLGKERKASSRRGVEALIEALALRFGWPEVAFLRLDRRGSGRLGAQELRMGLLLGAGLDFPAVTGLTAEALLAAIDRRCAGAVERKEKVGRERNEDYILFESGKD